MAGGGCGQDQTAGPRTSLTNRKEGRKKGVSVKACKLSRGTLPTPERGTLCTPRPRGIEELRGPQRFPEALRGVVLSGGREISDGYGGKERNFEA